MVWSRTVKLIFSVALVALLDMVIAAGCMLLAYELRFEPDFLFSLPSEWEGFRPYLSLVIFAPFGRFLSYSALGIYRTHRQPHKAFGDLFALFQAVTLGSLIIVVVAFLYRGVFEFRDFSYSRFVLFFDWLLNLFFIVALHSFLGLIQEELRRRGFGVRRVAIQGAGETAKNLARVIERAPESGYRVIGFVATGYEGTRIIAGERDYPVLGGASAIRDVINQHNLNEVVITNAATVGKNVLAFVDTCHRFDVVVKLVPDIYGILFQKGSVEEMGGQPVIQVNEIAIRGFSRVLKRLEDVALSFLMLLIFSPFMLAAACAIRLESAGPVLFRQRRIGKNGRHFVMYKFRSMYQDAEARRKELEALNESDGVLFKVKDDPRITRIGKILRKTSMDELPQLFNVLRGDMSLVGPRPLPVTDIDTPEQWHSGRFSAVPGITGMWQVNRSDHTTSEMLKWDIYYIENWSLWLDIKILMRTVWVVLAGKGAY